MRTDAGGSVYRECGEAHHHHLMCRSCGRTIEVQGPEVERWAEKIADQHGFTDVQHTLELLGTCTACHTQATEG